MSRVYDAFRATRGPCVLLESTAAPSPRARRSLLARNPRAALVADQDGLRQATADGARRVGGDAFTALRSMLRDVRPGEWPDEGGVAGALSCVLDGRATTSAAWPRSAASTSTS